MIEKFHASFFKYCENNVFDFTNLTNNGVINADQVTLIKLDSSLLAMVNNMIGKRHQLKSGYCVIALKPCYFEKTFQLPFNKGSG